MAKSGGQKSDGQAHGGQMNGGMALVNTLIEWGVDTAFSVPGESYLPILQAIQSNANRINLITPRHEQGVTFAAEAYGKLTGRPAAGFVSRGPGSTNASIGIHTAAQDSTPLVLFVGHVPTTTKGREAFQEEKTIIKCLAAWPRPCSNRKHRQRSRALRHAPCRSQRVAGRGRWS